MLTPSKACSYHYVKQQRPARLQAHFKDAGLSEEACDLLGQLLHLDPKKRMDARTAFGVRLLATCHQSTVPPA